MHRNPLPTSPTTDPPAESPLTLMQGQLSRELSETVSASLTGGFQDLLHTHEELAGTLAAIPELHSSPVVEIVVKAQEVIHNLLTVVELLRQGNEEVLEQDTTKVRS